MPPVEEGYVADLIAGTEGRYAVPTQSIRILSYLDADGKPFWTWRVQGEAQVSDTIGVLEMVKFTIAHQTIIRADGGD